MVTGPISWHWFAVNRIGGIWLRRCAGCNFNIISGFLVFGKLKILNRDTQAPQLAPAMRWAPPPCIKYYNTALVSNTQGKRFAVRRPARPADLTAARPTDRPTEPAD